MAARQTPATARLDDAAEIIAALSALLGEGGTVVRHEGVSYEDAGAKRTRPSAYMIAVASDTAAATEEAAWVADTARASVDGARRYAALADEFAELVRAEVPSLTAAADTVADESLARARAYATAQLAVAKNADGMASALRSGRQRGPHALAPGLDAAMRAADAERDKLVESWWAARYLLDRAAERVW